MTHRRPASGWRGLAAYAACVAMTWLLWVSLVPSPSVPAIGQCRKTGCQCAGFVKTPEGKCVECKEFPALCKPCPDGAATCPAQADIDRLIKEAKARLAVIESAVKSAAGDRISCQRRANVLRDVCIKARQPDYDECLKQNPRRSCDDKRDEACPPDYVVCRDQMAKENRLTWQRMIVQQDVQELGKLDFKCPGPDGRCRQISLSKDYEQFPNINERLCAQGTRAEFTYLRDAGSGAAIGRVFLRCV